MLQGNVQDVAEEGPLPPRAYSPSFYFVFLFLVVPLWFVLPFSLGYVIYALSYGRVWSFAWPGRILFAIALTELFFSVYHYHLSIRVSGPSPVGPGEPLEIQAAVVRLLKTGLASLPVNGDDGESERPSSPEENIIQLERDDPRAIDFRNCLRTWFCKVPWSSIKLHEVRQWLYWSIFNAPLPPLEEIPHSRRVILDAALDLLEKRSGCKLGEGSNPAVPPILLTLDKVNVMWRPLIYYAIIWTINFFLGIWYESQWKARFGSHDGLEKVYLIRVPNTWDRVTGPRPIVFLHGLGLGLLQYSLFITHLLEAFPDHPLLVLLPPQTSQNIFHPNFLKPLTRHQTADRLAELLHGLGWVHRAPYEDGNVREDKDLLINSLPGRKETGITVISHSNGSYTHAWMLKHNPHIIGRSCFVDPVTFCSWEGDVCYNFIYRPCTTGIELLMRYFVGTELGVANLLQRHFDWASNSLWFEEIPNARDPFKAFFLLGGKDDIVHAERVKRYLNSHGVSKGLWYNPNGRHGQALLTGSEGHDQIIQWLQEAVKPEANAFVERNVTVVHV